MKSRPVSRDAKTINTNKEIRELHRRELLATIDGAGLREAPNHPESSGWVVAPSPPMRASAYIGAMKDRASAHLTGQRAARTRGRGPKTCDAGCNRPETLGHISQTCPRTHEARTARHDQVLTQVDGYLCDRGVNTIREPTIRTTAGVRRPDLLVAVPGLTVVLDAQVVADNANLEEAHQKKVKYYNTQELAEAAQAKLGVSDPVQFSSITLNWR